MTRADDSVMAVLDGAPSFLTRARGFVPKPIDLGSDGPSVLAVGAHLKATVTVTRGREAFVSQQVGSLDNAATVGFHVFRPHWWLPPQRFPWTWTSLYDLAPARTLLEKYVDFSRLRESPVRLLVSTVNVETAELEVFDSLDFSELYRRRSRIERVSRARKAERGQRLGCKAR